LSEADSLVVGCIDPKVHPSESVFADISRGDHDSRLVLQTMAGLALSGFQGDGGSWEKLWLIADSMSKEVSVLIDKVGKIWVDIGTRGEVTLAPPVGSVVPYRLWLHTHPWEAYASSTDRDTLASCSMILEQAIVLGHDHMVWLRRRDSGEGEALENDGPLSTWTTDKETIQYSSLKEVEDVE
tara:strand:- start:4767 stop:5315 length:549 start_codon:yes stop_codon:yes gene_type:complete